jgi:flagellar assembly protein FliH
MLKLDVFDLMDRQEPSGYLDPRTAAQMRAQAYDDGYRAGWQDATDQLRADADRNLAALSEGVQALAFTHAEARALVEAQLGTLIRDLLARLLPEARAHALPEQVGQELRAMLARDATARLVLRAAPGTQALLAPVLGALAAAAQVSIVEEPAFGPGQVEICGQDQQRRIDLDALTALLALPPVAAPLRDEPTKGVRNG